MIEKKRTFGALDTDRSPKLIEQGNYVAALNIRNSGSTGSQQGVIENIKGSRLYQFNLPAGQNTCIGHFSDLEENFVYFFVHNTNGLHQILRFNWKLSQFQVVLRTPVLNFNLEYYIVEAQVRNGQLFFNDTFNAPRCINIAEALSFTDAQVWAFQRTVPTVPPGVTGGFIQLENPPGFPPPPFIVGQTVTVVRYWREAWLDADPDNDLAEGRYHKFDPNPSYSGNAVITQVNAFGITLNVPNTGIDDFVGTFGGDTSQIGGVAYLAQPNRKFTLPFHEDYIKLYRPSPRFPVFCQYGSDEERKANNLRGRLYQFKIRFLYANGMKSTFGPICKLPLPRFEKNIPFQNLPVWQDNFIDIWFDTGTHDVEAIELAVKVSSDPVDQDWSLVRTFNKETLNIESNTSHNFRFYGDEVRVAIPPFESEQPQDFIPFRAGAFTFLRDNRTALGDCTEGFDHIESNIEIIPKGFNEDTAGRLTISYAGSPNAPTTALGLPAVRDVWFPLNRDVLGAYLLSIIGNQEMMPYWRARPINVDSFGTPDSSGNFRAVQMSTTAFGAPYPDGWQLMFNSPALIGGLGTGNFPAWEYNFLNGQTHPFGHIRFTLENAQGEYAPAPGAVAAITINYRIARFISCRGTLLDSIPLGSSVLTDVTESVTITHNGLIVSLQRPQSDSQSSYYVVSKTFTKVLDQDDTSESVRDYFLDQINNLEPETFEVELISGTQLLSPGFPDWRKRVVTATVSLTATPNQPVAAITGWPSDGANENSLFVTPEVSIPTFPPFDDNNLPIGSNPGNLLALRRWYELIGMNRMRVTSLVTNTDGDRGFKTGADHLLAIEYTDSVGRRATVSTPHVQYIPYFNEPDGIPPVSAALLLRVLSGAPPWAKRWQPMYAGNMTMFDWLTFEVNWIDFGNADAAGVKIALTARILQYNKENNTGNASVTDSQGRSNLSYSWTRGDRLRFLTFWTGDQSDEGTGAIAQDEPAPQFIDVEIIGEATDTSSPGQGLVLIVQRDSLTPYIESEEFGRGSLVEVYTPKNPVQEDQTLYYEIGEVFQCKDGSHYGNRLNQGPNTPGQDSPFAEVILKNNGDTFVIGRAKIRNSTRSRIRLVESSSFNDFYPSKTWGPGVANRFSPNARQETKRIIRYSDFILEKRNELNRYYDGNLTDQPNSIHGKITRIECPDVMLYVFQELNTAVMPVGVQELLSASGTSVLMRSDDVLGQIRYLPGSFGIGEQREALCYNAGVFYFPSAREGVYLALAGTTYEPISRQGRDNYWKQLFDYILKSRTKVRILSDFDREHSELIVHVPNIVNFVFIYPEDVEDNGFYQPEFSTPRVVSRAITHGYSPDKKGWVTEYPYAPDMIGSYGPKLLTWKNGQFYVNNETNFWNLYFNGEPAQRSRITLSFNEEIDAVKFLQSILLESSREPDEIEITTDYGSGQVTGLFKDDFEYTENQYVAAVLRDENSPGGILQGDVIRGENFLVTIEFDPSEKFKLFSVNLRRHRSEMTDR